MRVVLVLLIACALPAAELRVTVQDPSGARVAGAAVEVRTSSGVTLSGATSASGEAVFDAPAGRAELRIAAEGFEAHTARVTVRAEGTRVSPRLRIAPRKDEVEVSVDRREENTAPGGPSFSTVLTEEQIANLPDDPEELEKVLKEMAGPGATIRVDGFAGGRLPHKSQIKSIRFQMTPYSADEHDLGFMHINVQTKPGMGAWHGSIGFGLGDDALNARNFFAPVREPQQMRRFDVSLSGPLRAERTGSSFWFSRNASYDSRSSVGVLPEGPFANLVRLPYDATRANARFDHAIGKSHIIRGVYEFSRQERYGIRDFDLPERRSVTSQQQHALRLSDTGTVGESVINELRFQTAWNTTGAAGETPAPAIVVQGAFSRGGAAVDSERRWRDTELIDHVSFGRGKHAFKTGGQINAAWHTDRDRSNSAGTFTFASLAAFDAGRPQLFTQRQGDGAVDYRQYLFGGYFQDDIRVRKDLSLSLGVRYETQTGVGDRLNLAPRVGIAWSPFRSGRTTIRGGGGVFYQWFGADLYGETLRLDGTRQSDLVIADPGYPDPLSAGTRGGAPPSVVRLAPDLTMPYVWRASGGVQQQIGKSFMLRLDARIQRGVHLWYARNVNAPAGAGIRPDPRFGNVLEIAPGASSVMRGFMVGFTPAPGSSLGKRYFWFANYMFGKSENETDSPLAPPADSRDRRADFGPAAMDIRHRFNAMFQYSPGHGLQIGSMFRVQSAPPYNITTGVDLNRDTILNDRATGVGRNAGRAAGQWNLDTRIAWTRGIGQHSESGAAPVTRMIRMGEGARDIPDMPLGGKPGDPVPLFRVQLYAQVFNVFNHANLTNFAGVLTSPFFGRATAAMPGRRMEVGMKFSF